MADDFAQLVKQQADIVRIVGEYLKLRKTGAQNYTGLCPFTRRRPVASASTQPTATITASAATRRATSSTS
jgi:hypothetical protein